jgi:sulfur-carrier protein
MPTVHFTPHLRRHLDAQTQVVAGGTVREALEAVFRENPRLRGYILDDQSRLRQHVSVFVDDRLIADRDGLTDPISAGGEIYVMQALSGG